MLKKFISVTSLVTTLIYSSNVLAEQFQFPVNQIDSGKVSANNNKLTLRGTPVELGQPAPNFKTKHFNDKIANNYSDVVMRTISMDLPFAQSRFCKTENITQLHTLSDAVWREFAQNYGLLIEDMGLLARSVMILDKEHKLVYKQLVSNLAKEPDYISVEAALKKL